MLANYTPTLCVDQNWPVFLKVEVSIQNTVVSPLAKATLVALKKKFMSYFQRKMPVCKTGSFSTSGIQKKID